LFENEVLAELPVLARYLFIGLWCCADRDGRLEDRPKQIRARVFPHDPQTDVDNLLGLLCGKEFITRYQVDGVSYIQVNNFSKHQRPHAHEKPSVIPPHYIGQPSTTKVVPEHNQGSAIDALNPDSLIPERGMMNPSSLEEGDLAHQEHEEVIASIEKLCGTRLTTDDRERLETACTNKSPAQITESLRTITAKYQAGEVKSLTAYASSVIAKQGPVRIERDAQEQVTITRAKKLCADLGVDWKHYHVHALQAVTQHNGEVTKAVESTWADHKASVFTGDNKAWWDRFMQHLETEIGNKHLDTTVTVT